MDTRYTKSADGVSIAYQVYGAAAPTVLCIPGAISNLMLADATPALARFWERLGRFARVVRFDKRGTGLSDRAAADAARIDQQVPDVEAVRVAAGAESVVLSGLSQGATVAVRYAHQHPRAGCPGDPFRRSYPGRRRRRRRAIPASGSTAPSTPGGVARAV